MVSKQANKHLTSIIELYLENTKDVKKDIEHEIELRFGTKGIKPISRIDFENVSKKLTSLNFETTNSEIYSLKIESEFLDARTGKYLTSNIRVEIESLAAIQEYCKTNNLEDLLNKGYKVNFVKKNPAKKNNNRVPPADFSDFNFRINYNIEESLDKNNGSVKELLQNWLKVKKSFRYLCRNTLNHPDFPFNIDLSIVRSSSWNKETRRPLKTYSIKESNVFNNTPVYEIEAELYQYSFSKNFNFESPENIQKGLMSISTKILSGLQQSNFPISYKKQREVLNNMMIIIHGKDFDTEQYIRPTLFLGPSSKTLQMENLVVDNSNINGPNIRQNYLVTEKADGIRNLLFVDNDGLIYLLNMNMDIQFTGSKTDNESIKNSILDGELILHDKLGNFINLYASFDIYYLNGKDIRDLPFLKIEEKKKTENRLELMQNFVNKLNLKSDSKKLNFHINSKKFYPRESNKENMIFPSCNLLLKLIEEGQFNYFTDGLIFTPALLGVGSDQEGKAGPKKKIGWDYSLKWKPPAFNTIDFLVTTIKNDSNEDKITPIFEEGTNVDVVNQFSQYKSLVLRCGFDENKHGYINPCQDILDEKWEVQTKNGNYRPVRFYPTNPSDSEAGIAHIMLEEDRSGNLQMFTEEREVFESDTIVEFKYNMDKEKKWRWEPLRVRYDKTADYKQGLRNFGNDYDTANNNWHSMHYPVTAEMLTTGENITESNLDNDIYYNRTSNSSLALGLRNFHNTYVKKNLIVNIGKKSNTLIDLACGKGGDLPKWIDAKINFVLGLDLSKDNIENRINGACARYLNNKKKVKTMPYCLFLNGTSAKNIKNGKGLDSEKSLNMVKSVFGLGKTENLPKGISSRFGIVEDGFDICSCQFAIHYMFEDKESLNNFLRNVSECTKLDGYFIGTTYDGKTIFDKLKNVPQGGGLDIFEKGNKVWEIIKEYDNIDFNPDSSCLSYKINVFQESINQLIPEFLVNFEYLVRLLENYGFALISDEEAKKIGFPAGSGMFQSLFNQLLYESKNPSIKKDFKLALNMTEKEKEISFLNRYFIFKKIRNVDAEKIMNMQINEMPDQEVMEEIQTEILKEEISKSEKTSKPKSKKIKKAKLELVIEE